MVKIRKKRISIVCNVYFGMKIIESVVHKHTSPVLIRLKLKRNLNDTNVKDLTEK